MATEEHGPEIILGQQRDRCHVTREPWKIDGVRKLKVASWRPSADGGRVEIDHVILDLKASDTEVQAAAAQLLAACQGG